MRFTSFITGSLLLLAFSPGFSQEYKPFKVGLGVGFANGFGTNSSGGALVTLEPAYRISDQIAVGFRIEGAGVTRGISSQSLFSIDFGTTVIESYTLNGQYYFPGQGKFRPFVGIGLGFYKMTEFKINLITQSFYLQIPSDNTFGFYPRIGFDVGHFTLAVEYNAISATTIQGTDVSVNNSYLGIRLGGFFFGGKK